MTTVADQFPSPPIHMKLLADQTVTQFGYDKTSQVDYTFNSLGYRSNIEFLPDDRAVLLLGNTISFGVGLPIEETFAGIISSSIDVPLYNFSWGCYPHTNHDQLKLLENILKLITPQCVLFQLNNLNRIRLDEINVSFDNPKEQVEENYVDFRLKLDQVIGNVPCHLMLWDDCEYDCDYSDILIHNRYYVDKNIVRSDLFGPKSHKLIATKILQSF